MADTRMSDATGGKRLGWLIAATYFIHSVISTNMPRTDKTLPWKDVPR